MKTAAHAAVCTCGADAANAELAGLVEEIRKVIK